MSTHANTEILQDDFQCSALSPYLQQRHENYKYPVKHKKSQHQLEESRYHSSKICDVASLQHRNNEEQLAAQMHTQSFGSKNTLAQSGEEPALKSDFCLQNATMFLIIANVCLSLFMLLNGSVYRIYNYQEIFFGETAWKITGTLCQPFYLLFRIHSAGCLFSVWSNV